MGSSSVGRMFDCSFFTAAMVAKCPGDEDDLSITDEASASRLNKNMTENEDDTNGASGILFSIFLLPLLVDHHKVC